MGNEKNTRRIPREILGLLAITLLLSLVLFQILSVCSSAVVDGYVEAKGLTLTAGELAEVDNWAFRASLLISVLFFVVLFLFLLGERLSYIHDILRGIEALRGGKQDYEVPVEGKNELTRLAEAVNYLSATQREVKEKERALQEEKEQLIRTLSHDIRTPLTSILSYSELLAGQEDRGGQKEYLNLIRRKAEQIRDLTDILLDGGKRDPEYFEDARLLMLQLAGEFEETLEEGFTVSADLSGCPSFGGSFDVGELRRIFDNLASNVQKYADPEQPVSLTIARGADGLLIRQSNAVRAEAGTHESYRMGLNSIRRIAHNYGGRVGTRTEGGVFEITVLLAEYA